MFKSKIKSSVLFILSLLGPFLMASSCCGPNDHCQAEFVGSCNQQDINSEIEKMCTETRFFANQTYGVDEVLDGEEKECVRDLGSWSFSACSQSDVVASCRFESKNGKGNINSTIFFYYDPSPESASEQHCANDEGDFKLTNPDQIESPKN